MKKIGFCFLIYDIINHEEIWNLFFRNVDTKKYKIYIHYKYEKKLRFFEQYKLKNCISTEYGKLSIIHAHNLLFKQAYLDDCYKIISLSQSCIPFKSFDYVYNFLTQDDMCHFNVAPQYQCFPRCDLLIYHYDVSNIQKSSNWFILNKYVCEKILNENILSEYSSIQFPEEHFYITTIYKNNLQNNVRITPNLANGATTFTNWEGMDYKFVSTSMLKNYNEITESEIIHLLNSECLFGRKFNRDCIFSLFNWDYISAITIKE